SLGDVNRPKALAHGGNVGIGRSKIAHEHNRVSPHIGCSGRAAVEHGAAGVKWGRPANAFADRPNQPARVCRINLEWQGERIVISPQYLPIDAACGVKGSAEWMPFVANLYSTGVSVSDCVEGESPGALLPISVRLEKQAIVGAVNWCCRQCAAN